MTVENLKTGDMLLGRFGISPAAESIWRLLLEVPDSDVDYLAQQLGIPKPEVERAIQILIDAHLVRSAGGSVSGIVAIDPAIAIHSHIVREERQLSQRLEELATLRIAIPELASDFAHARSSAAAQAGFEVIVAEQDVIRQIYLASEMTTAECRSIYYASTMSAYRRGQPTFAQMLKRGVRCRSIIGSFELNNADFYAELELGLDRGEVFRALPEVPTRLLTFDRALAVLPVDASDLRRGAIFVRAPTMIDMLTLLFDHMWSIADPVFTASDDPLAPTGRCARTLELIAIGTKDERIARTLGVGVRTVRRDVADLKAMLGVASRTEVIATAIRKGWL
jgi:DNA-binding CsgD family transcriptional regulator/sugar-specific transcriptional regulator TrmB